MNVKWHRTQIGVSLSGKEKVNYKSYTRDKIDPNQINNEYLL